MLNNFTDFRCFYQETQLRYAFLLLDEKGYKVDRLCIFERDSLYKDYKECPLEFITFKGFERSLPNIPEGFELAHIMDEECSLLSYRYEDGLKKKQFLNAREEFSETLLSWVKQLPKARRELQC